MRKRNILSITAGIAMLAVVSCSPIITDPLIVTDNAVGSKVGVASYRLNFFGLPKDSQLATIHIAIISENKSEIFGEVIKSPLLPKGVCEA